MTTPNKNFVRYMRLVKTGQIAEVIAYNDHFVDILVCGSQTACRPQDLDRLAPDEERSLLVASTSPGESIRSRL